MVYYGELSQYNANQSESAKFLNKYQHTFHRRVAGRSLRTNPCDLANVLGENQLIKSRFWLFELFAVGSRFSIFKSWKFVNEVRCFLNATKLSRKAKKAMSLASMEIRLKLVWKHFITIWKSYWIYMESNPNWHSVQFTWNLVYN